MVPHWISSPWSTANPLTLLVVSDCSSGNNSIALAKAAVVAGHGGSYPHHFTLSISPHLWLISRCCRRPLGFGFFNFLQKLVWRGRVPIFGTLNADGVRNLNCCTLDFAYPWNGFEDIRIVTHAPRFDQIIAQRVTHNSLQHFLNLAYH